VNLGYAKLDTAISGGSVASSTFADAQTGELLTLGESLDMDNNDIVNIRGILSANGTWSIDENGNLKVATIEAEKIKTQQLEIGSAEKPFGTTLYDVENGQPYCAYIKAGALQTVSGTCEANTHLFSTSGGNKSQSPQPKAEGAVSDDPPSPENQNPEPADNSQGASSEENTQSDTDIKNTDSHTGDTAATDPTPSEASGEGEDSGSTEETTDPPQEEPALEETVEPQAEEPDPVEPIPSPEENVTTPPPNGTDSVESNIIEGIESVDTASTTEPVADESGTASRTN